MKPLTVSRVRSLLQRAVELGEHRVAVVGVLHVDEVDDDDAAEVAQPQLARDHLRRLEVGLEDRVVEAAAADEAAGVDVDRRHRLGLVDDQVAARLEVDAARERLLDLVLDAVQVEERPLADVVVDAIGERRRVLARRTPASCTNVSRESTRTRAVSSVAMSRSTRCARFRSW